MSDFGLAEDVYTRGYFKLKKDGSDNVRLPYKWIPPESFQDGMFSEKSDVVGDYNYSKTSNNGPSEKQTTSVQRTAHLPLIDFTIELIHFEPPRSGHLSTLNNGH